MFKRFAKVALAAAIVSLTFSLSAHANKDETLAAAANTAILGAEYQGGQSSQSSQAGEMASFKIGQGLGSAIGFTALPDMSTLKMLLSSSLLGSLYIISRRRK